MLVKKDGKWSLLEFNLKEQPLKVGLSKSSIIQKLYHNTLMAFQLIGKRENTRAYTIDESGNLSFWNIDPTTGDFYAPFHHLNGNSEAVAIVGLETNGVLLEPTTFSKRITIGEGFKVTGPAEVAVTKSGKASFELVLWNNSEQDSAPFEVVVDNGATRHFDGLKSQQSVEIPVNLYVKIPALEDYTNKTTRVKVSEKGMPERTYKVTIKFAKPSKKG